jgi:protein-S-isoprenylcysteine O-methyltransferase Ste14
MNDGNDAPRVKIIPPPGLSDGTRYRFFRHYLGITIAGQPVWALILLPVLLTVIQRRAIEPEEAFLEQRFGANYINYAAKVRRWL